MQYHGSVHDLAGRVLRHIRDEGLLRAGDRVGVAVSAGADSVALLRLFLELRSELGVILSVVHVNHRIRGADADADQQFVSELAHNLGLPLHLSSGDTPAHAVEHRLSLEAAGREVRYQYFLQLLAQGQLDRVATAHTLDDQAETVLLRLTRGTGTTGLAGIYPKWSIESGEWPVHANSSARAATGKHSTSLPAAIIRPLLRIRRSEVLVYLQHLAQPWREDASNQDLRFARNRVRHKILPLLEGELNPRIHELLAETAEIARAEEDYWAAEASRIFSQVWTNAGQGCLSIGAVQQHPLALQRRLVRAAGERLGMSLEFQHVEELLALIQTPAGGERQIVLPSGWRALRRRDRLEFKRPAVGQDPPVRDFAYPLSLPGEVAVAETGTIFRAVVGPISPETAVEVYDPACLPRLLQVRNWRPGDRFWPQHTRAPRKIKELLQERKIPQAQRRTWPVITRTASGQEEIIWLRGFRPPQALLAPSGQAQGLRIEERALHETAHGAEYP
ncbi:MAG TPA: tRNA lysidine(34) synthetase TilS [Terriglobales bacterium]|nr:tRNA lysidine(34) synthetase TilS [Terriglobales bacterium]